MDSRLDEHGGRPDSAEDFARAFAASPAPTLITRVSDGLVLEVNESWLRLLGLSRSETIGKTSVQLGVISADERCDALGVLLKQGYLYGRRLEVHRKDGETTHLSCTSTISRCADEPCIITVAEDVTGRVLAEAQLRETRERFELAMEASQDGLWDWDVPSGRVYYSPAYMRMLGYNADERPADVGAWLDLIHPEDRDRALAANRDCIENRCPRFAVEFRMRTKDGAYRWILGRGHAVRRDASGRALRMIGTHTDVTARRQAEEALRQSEAALRALVDGATDGIVLADLQSMRLLMPNPRFCSMTGYGADEIGTMHMAQLHPPEALPIAKEAFARQVRGEIEIAEEIPVRRKAGDLLYADIASRPVVVGGRACLMGVFRDVTKRRQAEEGRRRLIAILEASPDFVGFATAADMRICYINRAGRAMVGIGPDEDVTALHVADVHPEWAFRWMEEAFFPAARRDGVWNGECVFRHRDGTEIPVLMALLAHRARTGEVEFYSTISRDITARKRTETAIVQAKEELQTYATALESANRRLEELRSAAEAATRAKSEFLANVSHEIRTPMTAILGHLDLLSDGAPLDDDRRRQILDIVQRNGRHLLELINDILDLSKIEAGKLDVHREPCSPTALATEIVSLLRVRAEAKGLAMECRIDGPLPERVTTDPARLRQILWNLLGNAVKFTDRGGICVALRAVSESGRSRLEFDVTDTGVGMADEQIARLFKPFTQVDASPSRRFGGTGLGLAICGRLVEALGGSIEVRSRLGQGSTFRVILDFDPAETSRPPASTSTGGDTTAPDAPPTPAAAPTALDARILLAEDEPDNQWLFVHLLKKAGAEVTAVDNGRLAVAAVFDKPGGGRPFDLVLMDMQMPVLDGYAASCELRRRGFGGPILALTAHILPEDVQKCLDAGCNACLLKPIDRRQFVDTVAHWAERRPEDAADRETTPMPGHDASR